jgi:hypothetical protein
MGTDAAVEKPGKFFHRCLQNACWRFAQFPQARWRLTNNKRNRTDHLLQKPDISICYRHRVGEIGDREELNWAGEKVNTASPSPAQFNSSLSPISLARLPFPC